MDDSDEMLERMLHVDPDNNFLNSLFPNLNTANHSNYYSIDEYN